MLIQLVIIQVITFLVIIFVLKRLLYSETAKEIERLRQLKDEFSRKEKELQVNIDTAKRDVEARIEKAEKEAREYLEKKEKEADEVKNSLVAKARDRAEEMVKNALNSKEKMREEVYLELKDRVPATAVRIFREALSAEAREIMHEDLVKDVIEKMHKMDKGLFKTRTGKGELLTPYPMKRSEKEKLVSLMDEKAGHAVGLVEKEDKDLIAGIVIKLDALIIDGSLENKLKQMQEKLG